MVRARVRVRVSSRVRVRIRVRVRLRNRQPKSGKSHSMGGRIGKCMAADLNLVIFAK